MDKYGCKNTKKTSVHFSPKRKRCKFANDNYLQMMRHIFFFALLCTLILSCKDGKTGGSVAGDTIVFRHARFVSVVKRGEKVKIDIRNPWNPASTLRSICVQAPIKRAAIYTATHAALLAELGLTDHIGGLFDTKYIMHKGIRQAIKEGKVRDLGTSNAVNLEQIMDLQPDLLMPSPYENQGGYGRLEQMGIPILECADYMEVSPLARAEWIRVYGILFGVEKKADSLFNAIEHKYNTLKTLAQNTKNRPRLLTERPLSGTWHVPCGESTTGILYRDAGADYIFSDLPGSGASAMSIEMVLDKAISADLWLIKSFGPMNREQIIQDCPPTKHIPARLMVCNTMEIPFFEETPFHPEYLLENLIGILHPELGITPQRSYFK